MAEISEGSVGYALEHLGAVEVMLAVAVVTEKDILRQARHSAAIASSVSAAKMPQPKQNRIKLCLSMPDSNLGPADCSRQPLRPAARGAQAHIHL